MLDHSITVKISSEFNDKNIHKILLKGQKMGFSYYMNDYDEIIPSEDKAINIHEAVETIISGIPNETANIVRVKFNESFFNIFIRQENHTEICVMIYAFGYPFYRTINIDDNDELDLVKYTRIMLELIDNIPLHELEIIREWNTISEYKIDGDCIIVKINLLFQKDDILRILKKGTSLGFMYYLDEQELLEKKSKHSEEVLTDKIIACTAPLKNSIIKIQLNENINWEIGFFPDNPIYILTSPLIIRFSNFQFLVSKSNNKYNNKELTDIKSYINFMLDLIEDYRIIELYATKQNSLNRN